MKRLLALAVAAWAWGGGSEGVAPARASDGGQIAVSLQESGLYLAPWETGAPLTGAGVRFLATDDEVDFGLQVDFARPLPTDLRSPGVMGGEFVFRFHDDIYGSSDLEPFLGGGASYHHYWAGTTVPAGAPEGWETRNGFGLRLLGGVLFIEDGFYLDLTLWGGGEVLWPEPSWVAGGGVELWLGIYLD